MILPKSFNPCESILLLITAVLHGVSMANVWDVIYIKLFSAMWMNTLTNENKPRTYLTDYGSYCSPYFKAMFSCFFWEVKVWDTGLWAFITNALVVLLVGINRLLSSWERLGFVFITVLYCIYLYCGVRLQVLLTCNMYKVWFHMVSVENNWLFLNVGSIWKVRSIPGIPQADIWWKLAHGSSNRGEYLNLKK